MSPTQIGPPKCLRCLGTGKVTGTVLEPCLSCNGLGFMAGPAVRVSRPMAHNDEITEIIERVLAGVLPNLETRMISEMALRTSDLVLERVTNDDEFMTHLAERVVAHIAAQPDEAAEEMYRVLAEALMTHILDAPTILDAIASRVMQRMGMDRS